MCQAFLVAAMGREVIRNDDTLLNLVTALIPLTGAAVPLASYHRSRLWPPRRHTWPTCVADDFRCSLAITGPLFARVIVVRLEPARGRLLEEQSDARGQCVFGVRVFNKLLEE